MSQCRVLAKYLPGAGGVRRHTWLSSTHCCLSNGMEGKTVQSSSTANVVSGPVTLTPDPFTI